MSHTQPAPTPWEPSQDRRVRRGGAWIPLGLLGSVLAAGILASAAWIPGKEAMVRATSSAWTSAQEAGSAEGAIANVVHAEAGLVSLSEGEVSGFGAHFYVYETPDKTIRFFLLRSSDGVIRVAFDACDVCFEAHKGYTQDGDEMVCNNCGTRFPSVLINDVQGGCNPAPLTRDAEGGRIVLTAEDIEAGARFF